MSWRRTISGRSSSSPEHRDDRVRVVADEADQLDAVGLARLECAAEPGGFLTGAQAQHP